MDISGEMQSTDAIYMTLEQFKAMENAMLDAIAKTPKTQPERPDMPGLPEDDDISFEIELCNLAYNNDEIFSSNKL